MLNEQAVRNIFPKAVSVSPTRPRGRVYDSLFIHKALTKYRYIGNAKEVARQLGVPVNTLTGWIKEKRGG